MAVFLVWVSSCEGMASRYIQILAWETILSLKTDSIRLVRVN